MTEEPTDRATMRQADMLDTSQSIDLVFRIAPKSDMVDATGALLRARVEITAQLKDRRTIHGRAHPSRLATLRSLTQFVAVEPDSAADGASPA